MGRKLEQQYLRALFQGNMLKVRHLILNEGFSPNHHFQDGCTPLQIAVEKNMSGLVQFLLEVKAFPDLKSNKNQTPLGVAVGKNNLMVVKMLLNHGARVELTDSNRRTPLHLASCAGQPGIVQTLIEHGASVNAEDRWGRSPLHVALYNIPPDPDQLHMFTKTVIVLLAKGAKISKKDKCEAHPVSLCASAGDHAKDICRMLLARGAPVDRTGGRKVTPLHVACMKGHVEICKVLLDFNCSLDSPGKHNEKSYCDIALENGHLSIARLLRAAGCSSLSTNLPHQETGAPQCPHGPLSLQILCRKAIRAAIGSDLHKKVTKLPYPSSLKDYILLKDVL